MNTERAIYSLKLSFTALYLTFIPLLSVQQAIAPTLKPLTTFYCFGLSKILYGHIKLPPIYLILILLWLSRLFSMLYLTLLYLMTLIVIIHSISISIYLPDKFCMRFNRYMASPLGFYFRQHTFYSSKYYYLSLLSNT